MAFIRTKKIKGNDYAYLVENRWKKRGKKTKQRSKKYLGRVYRFDRSEIKDFYEFYDISDIDKYIDEHNKRSILDDLLKLEFFNHGFIEEKKEDRKTIFRNQNCFFNMNEIKVYNDKGNPIALAFNEGLMTTYVLRKIINFKADCEEDGYDLAKMFVEAGISIPKEIFVGFFDKVFI